MTSHLRAGGRRSGFKPYRVMLVDDSAVIRSFLDKMIGNTHDIEVVGKAVNGKEALTTVKHCDPEVVLLDIEMPEMDGLTALPMLLQRNPQIRVIMVSTLTTRNAKVALDALALGASDYLEKPSTTDNPAVFERQLMEKIRGLGQSLRDHLEHCGTVPLPRVSEHNRRRMAEESSQAADRTARVVSPTKKVVETQPSNISSQHSVPSSPAVTPAQASNSSQSQPNQVKRTVRASTIRAIAFGSSTGGPQALVEVFGELKNQLCDYPVFITQHMPPRFTTLLAERIMKVSGVECIEPTHGQEVEAGKIYLAPGDYHMTVKSNGGSMIIRLNQQPPVNFCRPAVDVMFDSMVDEYGGDIFSVILTGMGQDGLDGGRKIVGAGGHVLAQDEETSVVWGMPGAVAKDGICTEILPLNKIASYLIDKFGADKFGKQA